MTQMIVLSTVALLHFVSWHLISPFIALVAKGQGASPETVGLIMAAYAVLPMIAAIPTGFICDRVGTRKIFIVSSIGIVLSAVALLLSRAVLYLALVLSALGLFHVLQSVATQVAIADTGDEISVYKNYVIYGFCCCVGQLVGPPVGGLVAKNFGYDVLFMTSAALTVFMIPLAFCVCETKPQIVVLERRTSIRESVQSLLQKPSFMISLLVIFSVILLYSMRTTFYSLYFDEINLDTPLIGMLLTVQGAAEAAIRPFVIRWRNRYGTAPVLFLAIGACAISSLITPLFRSLGVLAIVLGLGGAGYGIAQPISMALASQAADHEERGLAMGVRMFANRLSGAAGPLLLGKIGNIFGIKATFTAVAIAITACLLMVFILARADNHLWLSGPKQARSKGSADTL
ncbi:MAG: MFS transporter [Firmicutes bacterium]|nr:MFS transporter [Bacillota bacterium]